MENKLLEEKHQRKLLQDCTEQVIILYMMLFIYHLFVWLQLRTSCNLVDVCGLLKRANNVGILHSQLKYLVHFIKSNHC